MVREHRQGPLSSHNDQNSSSLTSSTIPASEISRNVGSTAHDVLDLEKTPTNYSTASRAIQRIQTGGESVISRLRSRPKSTYFSHPLTHQKTLDDVIVDFDGPDDPYRPVNWPSKKKITTTLLYGFTTMWATWASSVYAPAVNQISHEFQVGTEVSLLGLSLLLFGFGVGPLLWAPLSEVYGRKPAVLAPYFIAAVFSFGSATAKDIQTLMLTRFFSGFFGAAPITNTGGVLGDIWAAEQRGVALVVYAMAVVGGPVFGPIVGGAIVQSYLRWRWTEYITGTAMLFILFLDVLLLDESYPPVLLVYKARRLRHESGNWALHARHEEWDVNLRDLAEKFLIRPFQMLATPICFFVALYAAFVYGILYLNLAAFPIEFEETRGWNQVVGELPFLAIFLGILIGAVLNIVNQKFYVRRLKANNYRPVPEARLPPMMAGSVLFAVGLFIFAWTSPKDIHWIAPCIGAMCIGFGFFTIFQAALNYLVDTFQMYAASAIAANTFLRSMFAGVFPLFVNPMFHNLGIPWAASILAFFAVALIPIPYLFYIYGKRIRARGKWSVESTL
ncbi:MAG: hypothetical protein M1834_007791 [Cirrosporium novae-zelandiae]|nr:MAG: hypothetical protein M1834_007791 [Cirrosporium novae-zelandiae]